MIHRDTRALATVFFGRLFENEAFSSSRAAASGLIWILALVATPGVMFSFLMSLHYSHLLQNPKRFEAVLQRSYLSHETLFVDVAMAVAVLAAMLVWTSLTPDRKDVMVLGSLPVTAARQARARLLAITVFIALFVVAMSVPTAVAFTLFSRGPTELLNAPRVVAGHIAGTGLGAAFAFFALVNLQLILAAAFGPRAVGFATLPLQIAALLGVVAAVSLGDAMVNALFAGVAGHVPASLSWNAAAWFIGLYRYVGGDERPLYAALAQRAVIASAVNVAVLVVLYPLAYGQCARNVIAHEGRRTSKMSRVWARAVAAMLRPALRAPLQRGLAAFMLATLGRGQTHRFIVGSFAGLAFVLSLALAGRLLQVPSTAEQHYAWFAVPLGYVFWLVCGIRMSMMFPVDARANWLFRITEPVDKRRVLTTVTTVTASLTAIPIAATFAGVLLILGEQRLAGTVFAVVLLAGLALIELLTLTTKAVPFSATYFPGQLKLRIYWAPYFFLWLGFVFTLSTWSVWALESWRNTVVVSASLLTLWVALRVWHMARVLKLRGFVYDEVEPEAVTLMELSKLIRES